MIVDASTGRPIAKVAVTAYGTIERKDSSLCPKYDEFLTMVETRSNGAFTLLVRRDRLSYVVTYCSPAYATFTRLTNNNSSDGTMMEPRPVRLFPRNARPKQMSNAIRRLRDETKKTTIDLYKADSPAFVNALLELDSPERHLVAEWTGTAGKESSPEATPLPRLERVVHDFRTTLDYFSGANPEHFREQVKGFGEVRRYVDERKVPKPVPERERPPKPDPPPTPLPVQPPNEPILNDFAIVLASPRNNEFITGRRVLVKGLARRMGDTAKDAAPPERIVMNVLERRKLQLVAMVRPVASGRWWAQPELEVRDGEFQGWLYLGEESTGIGERFEIVVIVVPHGRFPEGTTINDLPTASSRSQTVTVLRER